MLARILGVVEASSDGGNEDDAVVDDRELAESECVARMSVWCATSEMRILASGSNDIWW